MLLCMTNGAYSYLESAISYPSVVCAASSFLLLLLSDAELSGLARRSPGGPGVQVVQGTCVHNKYA